MVVFHQSMKARLGRLGCPRIGGIHAHGPPSLASEQASGDLFIAFSANGHLTAERNPNGKPGALRQTKAASPGSRLLFVL